MARIRRASASRAATKEFDTYLRRRAWDWARTGLYALATDYVIRLLNRHPRDPLALSLGCLCAHHTRQDELYKKCVEAQRRLCFVKDTDSVLSLIPAVSLGGAGDAEAKRDWLSSQLSDVLSHGDASHTARVTPTVLAANTETLVVQEQEPLTETQARVRRAASCVSKKTPRVELLAPADGIYGRGLYATSHLSAHTVVMEEQPIMVQRACDTCCAHCLAPLTRGGVACPHCNQESYCSEACRAAAWSTYHICTCVSRNTEYAAWSAAMQDTITQGLRAGRGGSPLRDNADAVQTSVAMDIPVLHDPNSTSRAGVACLAVGKLCAMATVQQVHPLSLPGLRCLRGTVEYDPATALSEIGGLAVALGSALRQTHLFMEEVLSLFAVLQTNEFVLGGCGVALYDTLSLLNHSCDPNCTITSAGPDARRQLVTLREIRDGEQLFVNYNAHLTSRLTYEDRKALCAQRHFECFCAKCVRRQ